MARNSFSNMKTYVAAALHDSTLSNKVGDWINEAIQDIHSRTKFTYLHQVTTLNTTAGTGEYAFSLIATDIDRILYVRDLVNKVALQEISYVNLQDHVPDPSINIARPRWYYIKNNLIGFFPYPGATITMTIDYRKRSLDLSLDSDTPVLPIEWTSVILLGAEALGDRYLKRTEWPQKWQHYEQEVVKLVQRVQDRPNMRHRFQRPDEPKRGFGPFIQLWKT